MIPLAISRQCFYASFLFACLVGSGCLRFDRVPTAGIATQCPPENGGRLGQARLLAALELDRLDDTDGLLLRTIVRPHPEYGLTVNSKGVVRFIGGFSVRCHGALSRRVDVTQILELIDELDSMKLPTSASAEPGWSDVAEIRFGYRSRSGWREHVFVDIETSKRLLRAMHLVLNELGVAPLRRRARVVENRLAPEDCSGKWLWP